MKDRISLQKNCNILSSKLRPMKDIKMWSMTLYKNYAKSGNNLAPPSQKFFVESTVIMRGIRRLPSPFQLISFSLESRR